MKLRFLGTGTSTGVPQIGCRCATCSSTDPRDKRMRTSALVHTASGRNLLIDCGPDFYHQILAAGSPQLDGLLITHIHYDHVGGIDDLRPYCSKGPFRLYCKSDVEADLRVRLPYCFVEHPYPGVPQLDVHNICALEPFVVDDVEILPVPVSHYKLDIVGFRIGKLGYVTDCKSMPDETVEALRGVDTLVINALRRTLHMSHLSLDEALELIGRINPRVAYLTHLSHQMGPHSEAEQLLPDGVLIAYDGLEIDIPE